MRLDEHRVDRVRVQGASEQLAQGHGARVKLQERRQRRGSHHAALVDRRQDRQLVVIRPPEAAAVIQVQRVRLISERLLKNPTVLMKKC